MVQLKGKITSYHIDTRLIVHFCCLPEALWAIDSFTFRQIYLWIENWRFFL